MAFVTIPTASYVRDDSGKNLLLPQLLPSPADFNQQTKLWRFYCTCLDLGLRSYKLEDFHNKNMSISDKYQHWISGWRSHYNDISDLIRLYKKSRSIKWFIAPEQSAYRKKINNYLETRNGLKKEYSVDTLFRCHEQRVRENIDKLKQSAQHLLNARYTNKLAYEALICRNFKLNKDFYRQAA